MAEFRTRFAPSPTGLLHLGHVASANFAQCLARKQGLQAKVFLRIEDIDQPRCKPEFEQAVFEDLNWLGLHYQKEVRRQSEHFADYANSLQVLRDKGVLYRCFLTRREITAESLRAPHGQEQNQGEIYTGPARQLSTDEEQAKLASGEPYAWRLSMRKARDLLGPQWHELSYLEKNVVMSAKPAQLGDVVLARKDIQCSYHLAVVHDDAYQQINHVIRGVDLAPSTHVHVLLQALLGLPVPHYHHHELLTDAFGSRLAKRDGASSIRAMRDAGMTAAQVLAMAKL